MEESEEHGVGNQAWDRATWKALIEPLRKQDRSGPVSNVY